MGILAPTVNRAPRRPTEPCAAISASARAMDHKRVRENACAFLASPEISVTSVSLDTTVRHVLSVLGSPWTGVRALVTGRAMVQARAWQAEGAAPATKDGADLTAAKRSRALTWTSAAEMVIASAARVFATMAGPVPIVRPRSSNQTYVNQHAGGLTRSV